MNRSAINSSVINGPSSLSLILASASIICTADVSAALVRSWDALAPLSSSASITANATSTAYPTVYVQASGELYGDPFITNAGQSNVSGSASIVAYVLQNVSSSAFINCSASVSAIVASILGNADISATAQVVPIATKIQNAESSPSATGNVAITSSPLVTRYSPVEIAGTSNVRAETRINGVQDSYSQPTGTASITANAAAWTMQGANMLCTADVVPTITTIQSAASQPYANAMMMIADSQILVYVTTTAACSAMVTANLTMVYSAYANCASSANLALAKTYINHAASVNVDLGSSSVSASAFKTQSASSTISGSAEVATTAIRNLVALTAIDASADSTVTAICTKMGSADIASSADVVSEAIRLVLPVVSATSTADVSAEITIVKFGESTLLGQAEMSAAGVRNVLPKSSISSSSELLANALRIAQGIASIEAAAEIIADTIANPESYDPDGRTFRSPERMVEFSRPFIETEFRRAA
jgi:hypothetical protein